MPAAYAAQELICNGCKHIACISFKKELSTHGERVEGFKSEMEKARLPLEEQHIISVQNVDATESRHKVVELLTANPKIDGIFCTTDALAVGALKAATNDLGITVPQQLKIVGFDDVSYSKISVPSITTIRQSVEMISSHASDSLVKMIEGELIGPKHYKIPVQLIVRRST